MSGSALRALGEGGLWAGASALVLAAHVGAGAWIMGRADTGTPPGLPEAVFVDLAPAFPPAAAPIGPKAAAGGDAVPEIESEAVMPQDDPQPAPEPEPTPEREPEPEQVVEPIDPTTLDLPEFQKFTPPDIPTEAVLALNSSTRPKRRPEPQPELQSQPRQPDPVRRRQQEPAPAQAARTAGQGGQAQTSRPSGSAQGGGASPVAVANAVARWGAQIGNCIQRRARLPRNVRQGGQVMLSLTVARGGAIQAVGVAGSSGIAEVDQTAVGAAQRAGRCPPAPAALVDASYSFSLPITLTIR